MISEMDWSVIAAAVCDGQRQAMRHGQRRVGRIFPHHRLLKAAGDYQAELRARRVPKTRDIETVLGRLGSNGDGEMDAIIARVREIMGPPQRKIEDLKRDLYFASLDCWIDAGCRLAVSRRADQTLAGPLIRYLEAVLGPVMGDAAPAAEGMRKIIYRYRDCTAQVAQLLRA